MHNEIRRTRRSILAGGLGGLAAVVASAFGRPRPTLASVDGDVVLGTVNGSATTTIVGLSAAGVAFRGNGGTTGLMGSVGSDAAGQTGAAAGVYGASIYPNTGTYFDVPAVFGQGSITPGVKGASTDSTGVFGYSTTTSSNAPAIFGWSVYNTGIVGFAGTILTAPYNSPLAWETNTPDPIGVFGLTNMGGASAKGVYGQSANGGIGVHGDAPTGTGVRASSTSGIALSVAGKAIFSRSGRVAVTAGHSSYAKTLAGVTTSSLVIAVLQTRRSGIYLTAAVPGSGKFTIYLNKAVSATTYVAFLVLN